MDGPPAKGSHYSTIRATLAATATMRHRTTQTTPPDSAHQLTSRAGGSKRQTTDGKTRRRRDTVRRHRLDAAKARSNNRQCDRRAGQHR